MRRTKWIALCGLAAISATTLRAQTSSASKGAQPLPLSTTARTLATSLERRGSASDEGWEIASDASSDDAGWEIAADDDWEIASDGPARPVAARMRQTPAAGSEIAADEVLATDGGGSTSYASDYSSHASDYSSYASGGSCGPNGCGPGCTTCGTYGGYADDCASCMPSACGSRFWAQVDYLYWWQKGSDVPPLVSTSPNGTAIGDSGVLGPGFTNTATASIRVGNEDLNTSPNSGGRVQFGVWLDDTETSMAGGHFFMMATQSGASTNSAPNGGFILARPFFNTNPGVNAMDSLIVSHPDGAAGFVNIRTETDVIGAGMHFRTNLHRSAFGRVDILLGYRFVRMDDLLYVQDSTTITGIGTGRPIAVGGVINGFDSFEARNEFHGGDAGLAIDLGQPHKRIKASMLGKIAFGTMEQLMLIEGSTFAQAGASSGTFVGDLLAQETNIGWHRQRELAIVPEAQFNLGIRINSYLSANVGYTFMYVSRVQRAADAVDLNVDDRLLDDQPVAATGPRFAFDTTDFWLQGVNAGLELKY